jgi:hypothetical protein
VNFLIEVLIAVLNEVMHERQIQHYCSVSG